MTGTSSRGAAHPRAKLTEDQARAIRKSCASCGELARRYGISRMQAWRVREGFNRHHLEKRH